MINQYPFLLSIYRFLCLFFLPFCFILFIFILPFFETTVYPICTIEGTFIGLCYNAIYALRLLSEGSSTGPVTFRVVGLTGLHQFLSNTIFFFVFTN